MNFFELYKEYALLILGLFLIVWSFWRLFKDKKKGNPIAKKSIIAGAIGIIVIIIVSFIILR